MFEYPDSAFGRLLKIIDEKDDELKEKDEKIAELETIINSMTVRYAQNISKLKEQLEKYKQ